MHVSRLFVMHWESAWTREGRTGSMADDGSATNRGYWYHPGQQKFRMSITFTNPLVRSLTL
jgi:hypothetical protein